MRKDKTTKLCFIASSGGHLAEIGCLSKLARQNPSILITEKEDYTINEFCNRTYWVPKLNRSKKTDLLKVFPLFWKALYLLKKEKITHLITTGAMCSFPFSLAAKVWGIKVIYIESIARIHSASLTGKLTYPIADLFIVQWPEMTQKYKRAVYGGGIF